MSDPNDPIKGGAHSIYRAPASNITQVPEGNLLAAYLGPKNADYYTRHFRVFEEENKTASWNWPAFFLTFPWLLYRKMWLNAALYFFVLPIMYFLMLFMFMAVFSVQTATALSYLIWFLTAFIGVPIFANWLYFRHAQGKLKKVAMITTADQQALQLARTGGTSSVILVLLPFIVIFVGGILAAITIPAYQDYTIRMQVSDGISLSHEAKTAVTEYYQNTGKYPADNASAGVLSANAISGKYVASVEIYDGNVSITYGNTAHALINGKILLISPQSSAGILSWNCASEAIQPRHLPAVCR